MVHAHPGSIILMRHGRTDFNTQGRFQGASDIPLNGLGEEQAERASDALASRIKAFHRRVSSSMDAGKKTDGRTSGVGSGSPHSEGDATRGGWENPRNTDLAAQVRVCSSNLSRALATAQQVARACAELGIEFVDADENNSAPISVDPRFSERSYGIFEGHTINELRERYADQLEQWHREGESESAGIENSHSVSDRFKQGLLEHAAGLNDHQILVVVSHGSAITRGIASVLDVDPSFRELHGLDNCHWSELTPDLKRENYWLLAAHNIGY